MRFIAKVLKDSLHEKFPDAGEDDLLKVRIWTTLWIIVGQIRGGERISFFFVSYVCGEECL